MSETQHTQGTLSLNGGVLIDEDGYGIAKMVRTLESSGPYRPDDMRRLAACWNACAGIPTEALDAGVIDDLCGAVRTMLELCDAQGRLLVAYRMNSRPSDITIEKCSQWERVTASAKAALAHLSPKGGAQ